MQAGPERGWSHRAEVDDKRDTVHVFQRETAVHDLPGWSGLGGKVRIQAAPSSQARSRLGYVTLGEVRFTSTVRVSAASVSDGSTAFVYREAFAWNQGADVLVEGMLQRLQARLETSYPALSARERGEILGVARAGLWEAAEEGLFGDDADQDVLLARAAERTLRLAARIVRVRYPRVSDASLREVLSPDAFGSDEDILGLLESTLQGMNLALNTEIRFRLLMPGRVSATNAERREGDTLVWEFNPLDALATPVEIHAESVVAR
jgi:hypothetical protein